jgi:hypothetical protein
VRGGFFVAYDDGVVFLVFRMFVNSLCSRPDGCNDNTFFLWGSKEFVEPRPYIGIKVEFDGMNGKAHLPSEDIEQVTFVRELRSILLAPQYMRSV